MQAVAERVMDSNDIERERGITILSKNTAVTYKVWRCDLQHHSTSHANAERNCVQGLGGVSN